MSPESDRPDSTDAEALYEEFLRLRAGGETIDFDAFCADHPDAGKALRNLHSMHRDRADDTDRVDADETAIVLDGSPIDRGIEDRRIGLYEIVATLGEGGFGVVYLDEQNEPVRRQVALKILNAGMASREIMEGWKLRIWPVSNPADLADLLKPRELTSEEVTRFGVPDPDELRGSRESTPSPPAPP